MPVNIDIRRADPSDVDGLHHLILHTIRTSNAEDYEPAVLERICADFTPALIAAKMGERDVFVGMQHGHIAGTISLGSDRLHSLFVSPSVQGQGIGRCMVQFLERHARENSVSVLRLNSSITAVPFYQKLGYRLIERHEHAKFPTMLMQKSLA